MNHFDSPLDLAEDLMEDVRSLGLVSQNAATLKAFSHRVLASVKSMDAEVQVSKYNGKEFLDLISRLNQAVAPYLQQQATPTDKLGPIHIWVIDEADRLSGEQQSIIFRLIELFPALPFRVIWLSREPLQAWQDHANSESLLLDLDTAPQADETGDLHALAPDPLDGAVTENRDMSEAPSSKAALDWPASDSHKKLKVAAALAGAAVLGTLAWMTVSAPKPSTPETGASAVATSMAASAASASVTASEVPSTAPAVPAAPAASSPVATASQTTAAVAVPAAVVASAPLVSEAPKPAPAPKVIPAPPATHKALPEAARTGARWLKALPADTLVVEHGTFNSVDQAQKLKDKHKELGTARIIAVRKAPNADEWQYSVVTGPFRSEERAKTYVSRLDWRASTRIRGTDKLKPLVASAP
jgi:hypothetical protein